MGRPGGTGISQPVSFGNLPNDKSPFWPAVILRRPQSTGWRRAGGPFHPFPAIPTQEFVSEIAIPDNLRYQCGVKVAQLRKMRECAPFRPFQIHLASGEILPVVHPEQRSMPEDETEMFVVWTDHDWNLVEAAQVARVSVKRQVAK